MLYSLKKEKVQYHIQRTDLELGGYLPTVSLYAVA